ncbi:hypothetical protein SESBI_47866 [Sesbania bispinosa]|nr:hypothetical protein SESBI_47866 [Sesbania bispinosa]
MAENDLTLLNMDFRYFPDLAARHNFVIVYGTIGIAIIVNMNIGNSALFSSEAAIFYLQYPSTSDKVNRPAKATPVTAHNSIFEHNPLSENQQL